MASNILKIESWNVREVNNERTFQEILLHFEFISSCMAVLPGGRVSPCTIDPSGQSVLCNSGLITTEWPDYRIGFFENLRLISALEFHERAMTPLAPLSATHPLTEEQV